MSDDLPPRDHNQPPTAAIMRTHELVQAANAELARTSLIRDSEQAGRFQGFIDQLRTCKADLDAELQIIIAPWQAYITKARAQYRDPLDLIELARTKLQPLVDGWLDRQQARLDNEREQRAVEAREAQAEADQLARLAQRPGATLEQMLAATRAQEKADKLKSVAKQAPTRAQIKGEFSDKAMSMRTWWSAVVDDFDKAYSYYKNHTSVQAALKQAARADARKLKDASAAPPGVRFVKTEKAQ